MELFCKCGHRDKMHTTLEDGIKFRTGQIARICTEYADYPNYEAPYLHATEEICKCEDFVADNLLSIEWEAKRRNLL